MQIKDAIGAFFVEFSRFETQAVGMALRSLSKDSVFVEHAEQLLDLEARLKLLERMAFARGVSAGLIAELEACLLRARKLREQRDEVSRTLLTVDLEGSKSPPVAAAKPVRRRNSDFSRLAELQGLWVPALTRVQEYTSEATDLRESLNHITDRLERHLAAGATA